ncbi:MAG TPA: Erv1/Alr family FAD-linked sulfhydryl oxidase [Aquella sp.]|nr:Erv1/Alr family FAD-linked sulfhydryl oxidase [Aquella sp.]
MLPEIWGRYGWCFFHFVTLGYPDNPTEEDKIHYYEYITNLKYVLPCEKCRHNLKNHLKKYPLTETALSNRANLVKWGIDLHNIVNYYTGKPMLSYAESLAELNKLTNTTKSTEPTNNILYIIIGIVGLIIFILCFYRAKKN